MPGLGTWVRRYALLVFLAVLLGGPLMAWPESGPWTGARGVLVQCAAFGLLVWLVMGGAWQRCALRRFLGTGANLPVLLLGGWAALSFALTARQGGIQRGLAQVELLRLLCGAAVYFAVVYRVRSRRELRRSTLLVLSGAAVAAAAGLATAAASRAQIAVASFENPQLLAAFLVCLLPVAAVFAVVGEIGARRLLATGALVLVASALLLTQNRGAWLSASVGLIVAVALAARRSRPSETVTRRRPWLAPVLAALACAVTFAALVGVVPAAGSRLQSLAAAGTDASVRWRLAMASICANALHAHPLTGSGIGSFPLVASDFDTGAASLTPQTGHLAMELGGQRFSMLVPSREQVTREGVSLASLPHNEYLQMAAELGLAGLGFYLAALGAFFWTGVIAIRRLTSSTRRWMLIASMGAVASQAVDALSNPGWHFAEVSPLLWLMMGLGITAARESAGREEKSRNRRSRLRQAPVTRARLAWQAASVVGLLSVGIPAFAQGGGPGPQRPRACYLTITPTLFDFGRLCINTTMRNPMRTLPLTLRNIAPAGGPTISGSVTTSPRPPFSGGGNFNLPPGASRVFNITFAPTAAGQYVGRVVIDSDDPVCPGAVILLASGVAVKPTIRVTPSPLAFGNTTILRRLIFFGKTLPLTITNLTPSPGCPLRFSVTVFGAGYSGGGGGTTNGSVSVPITFRPSSRGFHAGVAIVRSNDPSNPVIRVPLTGTGTIF